MYGRQYDARHDSHTTKCVGAVNAFGTIDDIVRCRTHANTSYVHSRGSELHSREQYDTSRLPTRALLVYSPRRKNAKIQKNR